MFAANSANCLNELRILDPHYAHRATQVAAYYLWEARCKRGIESSGQHDAEGSALDYWLQGERQIKEQQRQVRETNPIYKEIERKAYLFSRGRIICGRAGNQDSDWLAAEREVRRSYALERAA